MKRFTAVAIIAVFLFSSCAEKESKGKFVVKGEIKNAPDQKIILEEVFFDNNHNPQVLDTAEIKNGKFTAEATASAQGLYRLRMEKENAAFVFINDQSVIPFVADVKNLTFKTILFSSPANNELRDFIVGVNAKQDELNTKSNALQQAGGNDSSYTVKKKEFDADVSAYKKFIYDHIDGSNNPVVSLFGLAFTRELEPEKLAMLMANLAKRFPKNESVKNVVVNYNKAMSEPREETVQPDQNQKIAIGNVAPDFSIPDVNGNPVSLSSFKGKYVLVDFWASWCGPCRAANPNIVNAYNTFKDKNFTIFGVSFDKTKSAWLQAIKDDNLTWTHVSDLKYWNSAVVDMYGFNAIPFNVLVDPQGKIAAINLEGRELQAKLAAVLK